MSLSSVAQETTGTYNTDDFSTQKTDWADVYGASLAKSGFCESSINNSLPSGSKCAFIHALDAMFHASLPWVSSHGKRFFGEHFNVVSTFSPSPTLDGIGLQGNIDVVFPLTGAAQSISDSSANNSLFLQQGMTRWWDISGKARHDIRHGLVKRFKLGHDRKTGVFGGGLFYLHNAEYGHEVLATNFSYLGSWGSASIRYFHPTTGWQHTRPGLEERALANVQYGARLKLTSTIDVNLTGYQFPDNDDSTKWHSKARFGFEWRPHPWLALATNQRFTKQDTVSSFFINLRIPFGGQSNALPEWQGLGIIADRPAPGESDLWNPEPDIGQIMLATRTSSSNTSTSDDISVRFVEDSVDSGDAVQLDVELSAPAVIDTRVSVRLVPGDGGSPAVAGVDFVDAPVEATIPAGERSVRVSITLLRNIGILDGESRSLSATVAIL